MPIEIERKFLVVGTNWRHANGVRLTQGYLTRDSKNTVRVRIAGTCGFLTIKGAAKGISRDEFEYRIPIEDAEQLMKLCQGRLVQKVRYVVRHEGMTWDVDEFMGENAGLVVAEIELRNEEQSFVRPPWLGPEVTQDPRYFNSNLVANPYSVWCEHSQ